jgi:ABC-type lipoprotein export system ATPase subunit
VDIPLGVLVCVTGASGSGKSSLVHEIIYKKLASLRYDNRILAGTPPTVATCQRSHTGRALRLYLER